MAVVPFRKQDCVKSVVGLDGRIVRPGSWAKSLGFGADIYGMRFLDITHPDDHGILVAVFGWLFEGHSRLIVSKRYVNAAGGIVPATMQIELAHDATGRPRYVRAWPENHGVTWGAASAPRPSRAASDVRVVREGFVAEPVHDDADNEWTRARRVGRLVLPPELL